MPKTRLTKAQKGQLAAASRRVEQTGEASRAAQVAWAKLVRELGIAAVARELDLTPQAVSARIKVIEARSGR